MDSRPRAPNALNQLPVIDSYATARPDLTSVPGFSQGEPRRHNLSSPPTQGYRPPASGNETEPQRRMTAITPMASQCYTAYGG